MIRHDVTPLPLNNATLAQLPENIARPVYDRSALTPGIVHIGLGNFHRAHQAWYLHRLMQRGLAMDWAIVGASVRMADAPQRARLERQDNLTTLIELDPSGMSAEVVGSMIGYLPIEESNGALVKQMSDPAIRIVSLTVTEGGYFLDPATKRFAPDDPDIRHDAANLAVPRTAFGAIVSALKARHEAGIPPFTCQSCDNLPGNGTILREVVTGLARLADPKLADWIEAEVSFPNSMVDCIVPATGPTEIALAQNLGIADTVPVAHENYRQWVIEDDFCAGRPPWQNVGVTMSDHVHDFEAQKLRLLNGGHQIIAAPAEILGIATIADAMDHPLIRGFLRRVAVSEIAPHVPTTSGVTPAQYVDLIERRFANPAIHDTVRRVAFDGFSRHTGAVLPAIRDAIQADTPRNGLALSQALWARMCTGAREDGSVIEPNDPEWARLTQRATATQSDPSVWLDQTDLYGEIGHDAAFRRAFSQGVHDLQSNGVEATLAAYLEASDKTAVGV